MKLRLNRSCKRFCSSFLKITHSKHHTKEWRKRQKWYNNGRKNECEIFQKDLIKKITNHEFSLCDKRFNITDFTLNQLNILIKILTVMNILKILIFIKKSMKKNFIII